MRIIVKPMGAVFFLVALVGLSMLALRNTPLNIFNSLFPTKLNGVSILSPMAKWELGGARSVDGSMSIATVKGQPFAKALHAQVKAVPKNPWEVQLSNKSTGLVHIDDVLMVTFYGRVLEGQGKVNFVFEQNTPPFDKSVSQDVQLTSQWKQYRIPFRSQQALQAEQIGINFQLAFAKQTVELADIKLFNYKKTITYKDLNTRLMDGK